MVGARNEKTRFAKRQNGFSRGGGKSLKTLEGLLESLAWGQTDALGSLDLNGLAGLGVDSLAGLTVDDLEGAESDQLEALVLLDEGLDAVDDCVNDLFGVGLGNIFAEGFLDGFNEMEFAAHGLCVLGWVVLITDRLDPKKIARSCQHPFCVNTKKHEPLTRLESRPPGSS